MPTSRARLSLLAAVVLLAACGGTEFDFVGVEQLPDELSTAQSELTGSLAVGTKLVTTTELNLRSGPNTSYAILKVMPPGAQVSMVTAQPQGGFYNVSYAGATGWAGGGYLKLASVTSPPNPPPTTGGHVTISGPAVVPHAQAFADAACAALGCSYTLSTYVGHSPSAELAIDFMQSRGGVLPTDGGMHGDKLAQFALDNFDKYKLAYVIWKQRINLGGGWRAMEDRGSITQNHFDHVHVSFDP